MTWCACHKLYVDVRGQHCGVSSLFLLLNILGQEGTWTQAAWFLP